MPTLSPGLIPIVPAAATPAARGTAAPCSSARAVYVQQKRDATGLRGAEIVGPGVAVPRITHADALALVAWWSREVPSLASSPGAGDAEVAAWARCALAARSLASGPVAADAGGALYPDAFRLWDGIRRIATAMDAHAVAPRNVGAVEWPSLAAQLARAASLARDRAADEGRRAIGSASDALATGAAKVSSAAGRGAGEGAIRGALSAVALPAAVVGVALVGGLVAWRVTRAAPGERDDHRAASTSPRKTKTKPKKPKKAGGRS